MMNPSARPAARLASFLVLLAGCGTTLERAPGPTADPTTAVDARCVAFRKAIETDIATALPAARYPCKMLFELGTPAVTILTLEDLPSPETPWSSIRVAVAAHGQWHVLDLGGFERHITELAPGPDAAYFHFAVDAKDLEPGIGTTETRTAYLCEVPASGDLAPRCAHHVVRYAFTPLDAANANEHEDWVAPLTFTRGGVVLAPLEGRATADTVRPRSGTLTFEAFLAAGDVLANELTGLE